MNIVCSLHSPPAAALMTLRYTLAFFSDLREVFSKHPHNLIGTSVLPREPEHRDKLTKLCFLSRTAKWTLQGSDIWLVYDSLLPPGCATDYSGARLLGDTVLLLSKQQRRHGSPVKHLQSSFKLGRRPSVSGRCNLKPYPQIARTAIADFWER